MNKRYFFILLLLSMILFSLGAHALDPTVATLEKTTPIAFNPPPITTYVFPNGLTLYFLENHELPILEMTALLELGAIHDLKNQKGLASLMMWGLRVGGAGQYKADEMDRLLADRAIDLSSSASKEYSTVSLKSRSQDWKTAFGAFFDSLQRPHFEPDKLEIVRQTFLEQIRRRNEEPMDVAQREFREELYGHANVWALNPTLESVSSIQPQDIQNFFNTFVAPNHMRLAVSGDITLSQLLARLKPFLKDWQAKNVVYQARAPVAKEWTPSVQVIQDEINQSSVILGHFGDKRFNPDKYALILANFVLGQSTFGSRLGDTIRTKLGLAYRVNSDFAFDTDYGPFIMALSTKSASTLDAILAAREILAAFQAKNPITSEELEQAKNSILNQFIFQYEDPFQIVFGRMLYDYFGYPPDYLKVYPERIRQVSLEDVRRVAQSYFFPNRLKILIVGDEAAMGNLNVLGEIQHLPLDND